VPDLSGGTCYAAPRGNIIIEKQTIGGEGSFEFTHNFSGTSPSLPSPFTLSTVGEADNIKETASTQVNAGTYSVSESVVANGFTLTSSTCTSSQQGDTSTPSNISLQSGETITCRFVNTKDAPQAAKLTILKDVPNVANDPTQFDFTSNLAPTTFMLTDGGAGQEFTTTGAYTITELAETGYTLTTVQCTGTGANAMGDSTSVPNRNTVVNLDPGDDITCTFTNRKDGSLKVKKVTIGGNDTFAFTVTGQPNFQLKNGDEKDFQALPPGQYTVQEINIPQGWTLQDADCGQGTATSNGVIVDLDPGESVTCVFTNFKKKDDRAEDVTKVFIHRRVDNLLTHGPDRARLLRRLQEGEQPQQSLKDGPLKLFSLNGGANLARSGDTAWQSANPWQQDSASFYGDNEASLFGEEDSEPLSAPRSGSFFSPLMGQALGLAQGSSEFKFGTSLSEIRAAAKAAEKQELQGKIDAAGLGFDASAVSDTLVTTRPGLDFWVEGHISRYQDGTGGINRDGDFRILYVGADYMLTPRILIGALAQIDDTREDLDDPTLKGEVEGTGWMAGPYIGIRLSDNLYFDARAAWGQSDNDLKLWDPETGSRHGSFETDRWLASASLTGSFNWGPWRFSPQASLAYGNEESDAYTTSLGQLVPGVDITIGRISTTSEIGYLMRLDNGVTIEPHVGITGIWNFDTDDLVIDGALVETNDTRAKIDGGVIVRTPNGWAIRAAGSYDGIGEEDFESYSGSLWLNVPLN